MDYKVKIKKNVKVKAGGCWEWQKYRLPLGYGRTRANGANILVHRLAWQVFKGPIPNGLCVCHRCDNPPCCNPAHLFLGTHKENMNDAVKKGRSLGRWPDHAVKHQRVRKLTHSQVDYIRSSGKTSRELATELGCSYHNVYMIRNGLRKIAPRK